MTVKVKVKVKEVYSSLCYKHRTVTVKSFSEDHMAMIQLHIVHKFGELPPSRTNLGDYDARMCNFCANSRRRQCDALICNVSLNRPL